MQEPEGTREVQLNGRKRTGSADAGARSDGAPSFFTFEHSFKASPHDLALVARQLSERLQGAKVWLDVFLVEDWEQVKDNKGASSVIIRLLARPVHECRTPSDRWYGATLTAHLLSDGSSRLVVESSDDLWPRVEKRWDLLFEETNKPDHAPALSSSNTENRTIDVDPKAVPPWEQIPDHLWHREALKLRHKEEDDATIARLCGVSAKTVENFFWHLRALWPHLTPRRAEGKRGPK